MNLKEYQDCREQKEHVDSSFPYNTYLCTIPLDFTHVPLHWHNQAELIVIKKGNGRISVNLRHYLVKAGDILLILPGQLHDISQYQDASMEYENIIFSPALLYADSMDLCSSRFLKPMLEGSLLAGMTHLTDALPYYKTLWSEIAAIDRLCDRRADGYQLAVKSHLFLLFYTLYQNRKTVTVQPAEQKSLERLKAVVKYVEEHYNETITTSTIAAFSGYSASHFMRFFKSTMGIPFTSYLNHYRLAMAARLLKSCDDSILTIAAQSGYDNLSYFNRLFRARYHMTPKEYRHS